MPGVRRPLAVSTRRAPEREAKAWMGQNGVGDVHSSLDTEEDMADHVATAKAEIDAPEEVHCDVRKVDVVPVPLLSDARKQ